MDSFYSIVIIIAFIALLLCLIAVGIMIQNQDKQKTFPTQSNTCPDGWGVSETGDCMLPANNTDPNYIVMATHTGPKSIWEVSDGNYKVKDTATTCDKYDWATKNGIVWDGISNYNNCS
tara:strand:- start:708 stop:1064 length:357 start_codon:yes stop_codon:yes gene_type:complete